MTIPVVVFDTVKLKAPLNTPLNVPVPPIVLLLPKTIGLLNVAPILNAPLPAPTPLIVIAFVLAKLPSKTTKSIPPLETVVLLVLPKPVVAPILKLPALTVVVPL